MIRMLHFSDLHLGVENYGRLDPETGLNSRLLDFLQSFDYVVNYALENDVDLVLFAGDAYKTRRPDPTYQREFARRIHRLSSEGIPVFLLVGNHDKPNIPEKASTTEIFETLGVANIHVADVLDTHNIMTPSGRVQIVALPWFTRSQLLTRDEFRNKSMEEVNSAIVDKVTNIISSHVDSIDPLVPAILAAHGTVQGSVYGSERSVMLGYDVVLPQSLVANPAFDYVALGHIHRHQVVREDPPVIYSGSLERVDQVVREDPPVIYSGSLERVDFGEENEEKGFVVVEVERGHAEWRFVRTPARKFVTIDVVAKGGEPMSLIEKAVAAQGIRDAVVRLVIHVTAEQEPLLRENEIRRWLSEAFHVAAIAKDVERPARIRLGEGTSIEGMTPRELLGRYLEAKAVSSERIGVLTRYAEAIFSSDGENNAVGDQEGDAL